MDQDELILREKKILAILKREIDDGENFASAARKTIEYLLLEKKGYRLEEVQKNVVFEVRVDKKCEYSSVDFLITVDGKNLMIIKCFSGSLSSRERQVVAAARLLGNPPVPFAVVADPSTAEVIDGATGKVIGEGFGAIPVREQIVTLLSDQEPALLSPERIEKEKRILLAFDAIQCSVPQGADGGVDI